MAIYPASLLSATVETDLTLHLDFVGAEPKIEVPQDPKHEAWHLVGPGPRLIVCPPAGDGRLAVWR